MKVIMEKTIKEEFDFLNGLNIILYIVNNNVVIDTIIEIIVNIFVFERLII